MAEIVSLEGMDHIMARIEQLGKKATTVENHALKAGAAVVQKAISRRAPRSAAPRQPKPQTQMWRTGEHLADNIIITKVKRKQGIKYVEVGPTPGDNSPFFYGKFSEYGTSKMPAQPFVGPAEAESKQEALNAIIETLKAGLDI
ncbi:MAG: HK97-gp10 family putative phage morphogenesis protein [Syntrophomonas sp.]